MTMHLSTRIAWHDSAWNGSVCRQPSCNSSCVVYEHMRNARDDEVEDAHAGRPFADLTGYLPPCSYEAATYSLAGYAFEHRDPVKDRGLPACRDSVRPFFTLTTPYRWMREENFADNCQMEGLVVRSSAGAKTHGWVTEEDRQRDILKAFWSKLEARKSLVVYYVKGGSPFDASERLIVGVGRVFEIGPMAFFGRHPKLRGQFPV